MLRTRFTLAAVAALAVFLVAQLDAGAWPPPKSSTPSTKKTTVKKTTRAPHVSGRLTHANRKAGHKRYVVQVRHPLWATTAPLTRPAADTTTRVLHHNGWGTRWVTRPAGIVVLHRMRHWHSKATLVQPAAAQQLTAFYQSQGFQTRVLVR
jgi:hypothetical protein